MDTLRFIMFKSLVFMSAVELSWEHKDDDWPLCSTNINTTDCCMSGVHLLKCADKCPSKYIKSNKSCDSFHDIGYVQASTQIPLVTTTEPWTSSTEKTLYCCEPEDVDMTVLLAISIAVCMIFLFGAGWTFFIWISKHNKDGHVCISRINPNKISDPGPVFSHGWKINKKVTCQGATLTEECSDVSLTVPYGAVAPSTTVVIEAAVSTDIHEVYRRFEEIPVEEYVASPIAEYTTSNNYRFQRSVMVTLPHFLPPSFSKDSVRVYEFTLGLDGKVELNQLKYLDADDPKRDPAGTCDLHKDITGVFFFDESDHIHILTNHFTGFFCTDCKRNYPVQQIHLDVLGKLEVSKNRGVQVDLRLEALDLRMLRIKDFQKNRPDRLAANFDSMRRLDLKVLPSPPESTDPKLVFLGARLKLMSTEDKNVWMHSQFEGGEQVFPTENTIDLTRLVPCRCRTLPGRIDWQLTSRQGSDFQCIIEVGYATSPPGYPSTFKFLRNSENVRFSVRLPCEAPTMLDTSHGESTSGNGPTSSESRNSDIKSDTYRWQPPASVTNRPQFNRSRASLESFHGEDDSEGAESPGSLSRDDSGLSSSSSSTTIYIGNVKNLSMSSGGATRERSPAMRDTPAGDADVFKNPVQVSSFK